MVRRAHGRLILWEGGALWVLDVHAQPPARRRTDFHAHHALQVTLALCGEFTLHTKSESIPGPAVVVSADASHAFEPKGSIALLFIDPESPTGRGLAKGMLGDRAAVTLAHEVASPIRQGIHELFEGSNVSEVQWRELGQRLTGLLLNDGHVPGADDRVERTLQWALQHLDERIGISEAARNVGLSTDRMSHLFVAQTGLPFRTYLLWLRMRRALDGYAHGASLTEAAHDAGFADSAHFSRTFRRMFGIAASDLELT
jgi:AraC family transcriptional regulator